MNAITVFQVDGWWHAEGRDSYLGLFHQGAGRDPETAKRNCLDKIEDWNRAKQVAA